MLDQEVHPRILERMQDVEKGRDGEVMDRQVRIYCLLNKAAQKIKGLEGSRDGSLYTEAENLFNGAASKIRRQAIQGREDRSEILEVYANIERLSNSITAALERRWS